jgi:MFS family permease
MENTSTLKSTLFQRDFLAVLIAVANILAWYFPAYIFFDNALGAFEMDFTLLLVAFGVQFAASIGSAFLGTALMKKFPSRDTFLIVWMITGIIASIMLVELETFNFAYMLIVSFLLGFSLGFGFPTCLAYFGDQSAIQNRGILAGITFLVTGLCILLIGLIVSFSTLLIGAITLAVWRGIGLLLFLLVRTKKNGAKEKMLEISYKSVLLDRSFLLYFIPWMMFTLINFLETPIIYVAFGKELALINPLVEFGLGGFVALLCGKFADQVGRKRVIIVGFVMLGIGYAVLGFFQGEVFRYVYVILDGIAWGILLPMFFLVIWSELAGNHNKVKYYLIGLSPFLIASYLQMLFTPYAESVNNFSALFSLAAFFLFLAVIPLLYAPETMPQKQIELKRLRKFADDAKKAKEKYESLGL